MPRAKAVDVKPRGRMSAYAFFVQTCREEHKRQHPDENVVFSEFSRKCAERWKTMEAKEKERFFDLANKDKVRYDAEMVGYKGPRGSSGRGRKRRQRKDPNAPKRALSAFFWFSNDERPKVRAVNPEMTVGDVAKELAQRWAKADPERKAKYEAMAEKDRARYDRDMQNYKMGNYNAKKQKVAEEPEAESDEEEDEDE